MLKCNAAMLLICSIQNNPNKHNNWKYNHNFQVSLECVKYIVLILINQGQLCFVGFVEATNHSTNIGSFPQSLFCIRMKM